MEKKPPKLKLVRPDNTSDFTSPPRKLRKHGLALWSSIIAEFTFDDAPGREMLCSACQALDSAELCAAQIAADGPVIRTKTGIREHPALRAELANRSFLVRTLDKLGLDSEPVKAIGRPAMSGYEGAN
jgi:hypothetical protein